MPPKVIVLTNQKGGTGKTTLTALLAYGLALRGKRALMIDLDPQAHLSSMFLKISTISNVRDGSLQMAQNLKFRIRHVGFGSSGVKADLVPSGLNYILEVFRGQIPSQDPFALYSRISREPAINKGYEYVLCDTPPELFAPTLWGLYAADYVIIPSNLEELSLWGTRLMLRDVIPEIIDRGKKDLKILGVALINITKKHKANTIKKEEENLKKFIKNSLPPVITRRIFEDVFFKTIIYRYSALADLVYKPRRWRIPLERIVNNSPELKADVQNFASEVEDRISNFRGLQ
jgi:chromosome partitioning protein